MTIGSLFSGIAGLELGLEMIGLGPILWQCERDPYAYNVLECRYPNARRYRDIRRIDGGPDRPAAVDIICGGFPCQDLSVAGKGAGLKGKRSGLWSEFARVVRLLRPQIVFVENVAALRSRGLDRVLGDLAALGFDAEWGCFRALDVGAPHIRERLFILAYSDGGSLRQFAERIEQNLADADGGRRQRQRQQEPRGFEGSSGGQPDGRGYDGHLHRFPPGPSGIAEWAGAKPAVRRGDHGLSRRVDRLRCLGNAVVPQQAALAFVTLLWRALEDHQ